MGGSGSDKPDEASTRRDGAAQCRVANSLTIVQTVERLRRAEALAVALGEFLEKILDELRTLPRWRPALAKRRYIEGRMDAHVELFHLWQDNYGPRVFEPDEPDPDPA